MSVTIEALPSSLMAALNLALSSGTRSVSTQNGRYKSTLPLTSVLENEEIYNKNMLSQKKMYENELETNIMDKETLLKTLKEHDVEIISDENNSIDCTFNSLSMKFTRENESKPYSIYIECPDEESFKNFMDEMDEEYKANVQEVSYNQIKENIEAKNYTIEQEEIMEDNTIVLTVNLE